MKQAFKALRRSAPRAANRLELAAQRGKIVFVPQSHDQVSAEGPVFAFRSWLFGVSPKGRLTPIRRVNGPFYSPARHETADGETVAEWAERMLGM